MLEVLRLEAVTLWSPGKLFILAAGARPQQWAAEDPLYVSPRGGVRVTGGSDKKGSGKTGFVTALTVALP